jgi:hypothetical protein
MHETAIQQPKVVAWVLALKFYIIPINKEKIFIDNPIFTVKFKKYIIIQSFSWKMNLKIRREMTAVIVKMNPLNIIFFNPILS